VDIEAATSQRERACAAGVALMPRDRTTIFRDLVGELSAGGGRARNDAVVASAHLSRSRP
jgi:hypothetical protein